ncbi:hypothetical protein BAU15_14160 [Enterococcus sp. JM4C]|uniref:GNAT family N-acetyltransferase n=1 Tax=Candidatus Enterococcus huntleyi TaxID=1857217 RepID=UPI00137B426D|nr:GNAT family N-acetyltransferase [Enterococcus sp. JM4C]KAF1298823.1 hypothetical protein BAU15_14160 [Enterococcus sp. JM4C]
MEDQVYICSVTESDLDEIVKLHCELFDNYFLKNLGHKLIYKYYLAYYKDEGTIFLKASQSNKIVGFVLTTSNYSEIIHRFYRDHVLELAMKIIWETLKLNKIIFLGLKSRIINMFSSSNKQNEEVKEEEDCLLSIAVKKELRGKSVAKLLVDNVEEVLLSKDVRAYSLSVKKDNPRAKHFYEKLGFKKIGGKGELEYYTKQLL